MSIACKFTFRNDGSSNSCLVTVHVSPSGKDFAAINWQGILFLVRDFERVERGEASFSDIALRINLDSPLTCLAFEHGRVVVSTVSASCTRLALHPLRSHSQERRGVFIINWDSLYHSIISPVSVCPASDWRPPLFPNLTMHLLAHFVQPRELEHVSCLQMTKTAVWLNWSAKSLRDETYQRDLDDDSQVAGERFLLPVFSSGSLYLYRTARSCYCRYTYCMLH